MAEIPVNGSVTDGDLNFDYGKMANWAGAIVSFGLVIGAGAWGYQLLARDVSGVPVVRAIEGPMREQPSDPGGSQADHQGLAVNAVPAEGTAEGPADRLVLAPPPIELSTQDTPLETIQLAEPVLSEPAETASASQEITAPQPIETGEVMALVDQLTAGATPLGDVATAPVNEPAAPEIVSATVPAAPLDGLGRSLRPKLRPANLKEATQLAAASAPVAAASQEVGAADIPAGTRLVQLGAFASEEIARAEWDKLQGKFADYLSDKKRVVQRANSGGRVFYRLRALGFADLSDARRLCAALKAENADCIPVVTR